MVLDGSMLSDLRHFCLNSIAEKGFHLTKVIIKFKKKHNHVNAG